MPSYDAGMSDQRPVLQLGHSPDPDDVFMWWPIAPISGPPAIDTGRFRFEPVLDDIESLNRRAESGELEISAISCAQYPRVRHQYALTACGASMGDGYGPKLVADSPMDGEQVRTSRPRVAIPGRRTSALAALTMWFDQHQFETVEVPFDEIIDAVASGRFSLGLVIHEGQLTFEQAGLHLVEDMGRWWQATHGTLLPLGANAIRRDLEEVYGAGTLEEVTLTLRRSIEHAIAHREQAVAHAMPYARGIDRDQAGAFINLYVNRWTLRFGAEGQAAVERFLAESARAGLVEPVGSVDFIDEPSSGARR